MPVVCSHCVKSYMAVEMLIFSYFSLSSFRSVFCLTWRFGSWNWRVSWFTGALVSMALQLRWVVKVSFSTLSHGHASQVGEKKANLVEIKHLAAGPGTPSLTSWELNEGSQCENGPLWIQVSGRLKDVAQTFLCVMLVQDGMWWEKSVGLFMKAQKNGQIWDVLP